MLVPRRPSASFLLATPTISFSLDRKRRTHKWNRNSAYDWFSSLDDNALCFWLRTTPTPSLVSHSTFHSRPQRPRTLICARPGAALKDRGICGGECRHFRLQWWERCINFVFGLTKVIMETVLYALWEFYSERLYTWKKSLNSDSKISKQTNALFLLAELYEENSFPD